MRRTLLKSVIAGFLAMLGGGCVEADEGPGMVLHFASLKKGVMISSRGGRLPNGTRFPGSGGLGYTKDWLLGGATEGAVPDGRQLPEWVEFEWTEHLNDKEYVLEELRALPVHVQRVIIRGRVPQDVIDEVMRSKREAKPGKLPEKSLWLYFVWTDAGIKFHWRLESPRAPGYMLRSGGDTIETL